MRPLVWTALPFRAEPMCEAEGTHHPAPELEELVRSDDLQFVLFILINTLFSAFRLSKRTVTIGNSVSETVVSVWGLIDETRHAHARRCTSDLANSRHLS